MRKKKIQGRIGLYLLLLFIAAGGTGAVTLARYTSQASGTGTAAIACFVSDISGKSSVDVPIAQLPETPGTDSTVEFIVTNAKDGKVSDVAQDYTITIRATGNLPYTYTLTGTKKAAGTGGSIPDGQNSLVNAAPIAVNTPIEGGMLPHSAAVEHTYTLKITWPAGTDSKFAGEVEHIQILVDSRQKLASGTGN